MIAYLMKAPSNAIIFLDEDLPLEGREAIVKSKKTLCVMINDGSAINVCPLRLLHKFGMNVEDLEESNIIILAYDDSRKPVIGTFKAVVSMGDIKSVIELIILNIPLTFTLPLGRPWFHPLRGIPPIVHQKIKF